MQGLDPRVPHGAFAPWGRGHLADAERIRHHYDSQDPILWPRAEKSPFIDHVARPPRSASAQGGTLFVTPVSYSVLPRTFRALFIYRVARPRQMPGYFWLLSEPRLEVRSQAVSTTARGNLHT